MIAVEDIKVEPDISVTLAGCDVCGEDHNTQACPQLQNGVSVVDAEAPSRARLTLPSNLRIKTLKDGSATITAREKIPRGTRFGPFEAPVIFDSSPAAARFLLKIFEPDGNSYYLDSTNERECNWMCYVQPAERKSQQNLMAYQVQQDIYFSSVRDIRLHEELRVWYAMHYGKKMGITPPWPPEEEEVENVEPPPPPPPKSPKLPKSSNRKRARLDVDIPCPSTKRGRKKKVYQEYVETHDYDSTDELMDDMDGGPVSSTVRDIDLRRLGFDEQREWRCSQCGQIYQNCIDFARHLQEHYNPKKLSVRRKRRGGQVRPKNFDCQFCSVKFSSAKLLQRHRLRLHRRQLRGLKKSSGVPVDKNTDTNASIVPTSGTHPTEDTTIQNRPASKKPLHMSDTDAASILLEIEAKCDKADDSVDHFNLMDGKATVDNVPTNFNDGDVTGSIPVLIVESGIPLAEDAIVNMTNATIDLSTLQDHQLDAEVIATENSNDVISNVANATVISEVNTSLAAVEISLMEAPNITTSVTNEAPPPTTQTNTDNEYVCDICKKSFEKSIYLFRHIRKHTGDFTCGKCHKVFARKESLVKHICSGRDGDNLDKNQHLCQFCHKWFGTKHLLRRHVAKHTGEFTCDQCGKSYCSNEILKYHVCSANKEKAEVYPCEICHKTFSKLKYLEKHIPVHTGTYACSICGKWLRSHDSLINHVRICGQVNELEANGTATCPHCKQELPNLPAFRRHMYEHTHLFVCEHCNARFRNKITLSLHVCEAEQSLPCEICKQVFSNVASLNKHRLEHLHSQVLCKLCGQSFDHQNKLLKHKCNSKTVTSRGKKKRPSLQPLICEICGSLFSSTSSLNVHRRLHGEKLYGCDVCGKRFHRKDLLIDHCAVHGEAAVPCPQCGKMFKTKKSLDVHLLIHDGVKRFSCSTCGKQFHQKGNLIKHEEVHKPDRKYECQFCQKGFSTKEYLAIHVYEHTKGRTHICDICKKSFVKEHQLRAHQRIFHTSVAYICKFCGLSVKLKHSLKRHLSKKHANESQLWSDPSFIDTMLAQSEQTSNPDARDGPATLTDNLLQAEEGGTEVLLAVAGIGSEELQQALASGTARIQQGSSPNVIEISLPVERSLDDAILHDGGGGSGDKVHARIIQLPISDEVEGCEMTEDQSGDQQEVTEIGQDQLQIAVRSAIESQITIMDDTGVEQQLHLQEEEMTDANMILLENGAVLQHGTSQDGDNVFFYVMNPDGSETLQAIEQSPTVTTAEN